MTKCDLDTQIQQAIDAGRTHCPVCCHEFEVLAVELNCPRCEALTGMDELIREWDDCAWDY